MSAALCFVCVCVCVCIKCVTIFRSRCLTLRMVRALAMWTRTKLHQIGIRNYIHGATLVSLRQELNGNANGKKKLFRNLKIILKWFHLVVKHTIKCMKIKMSNKSHVIVKVLIFDWLVTCTHGYFWHRRMNWVWNMILTVRCYTFSHVIKNERKMAARRQ